MDPLEKEVNEALDRAYQRMKVGLIARLCQEVAEDGNPGLLRETIKPYVDGKRV